LTAASRTRLLIPSLAGVLYFSEGFPFGIVNELFNLYLPAIGVPLERVGFINAVGFAWTLKFLWSPAIDLYGSYRKWIAGALAFITFALLSIAAAGAEHWTLFVAAAALLAVASATQDIAVDALIIRITPAELIGPVNSIRVTLYRIGMIVAGGGLAVVATKFGWRAAFLAAAMVAIAILVVTLFLPIVERAAQAHQNPFRSLWQWLRRPRALLLLVVILLYKLGDSSLTPMIKPYWIRRGFSAAEVGMVTTTAGVTFIILGAIAGGAFIARYGIYRGLLWLGVTQVLSNVGYAVVASTGAPRAGLYTAAVIEAFTYGLGTSALLAFLMAICDRENAATEYAMLSALFAVSRTLAATVSGVAAKSMGFAPYFWLTVFLGIPGLLLLPAIREQLRPVEAPDVGAVLES
jgi:PAT family beta-lactamase induction signal transducer AmpG